jgi:hypothetical protein
VYVHAALEEHKVASTSPPSDRSVQLDNPLRWRIPLGSSYCSSWRGIEDVQAKALLGG